MKKLYTARDEIDAFVAKGLLDEARIEAVVQRGGLGGVIGEVSTNEESLPSVWVRDEDFEKAQEAIAGLKTGEKPPETHGAPWKCPNCGEEIEPQFSHCWNCGAARPEGRP